MTNTHGSGWNWNALLLGPLWYISNGLAKKGYTLLAISIFSLGFAVPFIWVYSAIRANTDFVEQSLQNKSRYDIDKIAAK